MSISNADFPGLWSEGQLFAFSGLDGQTKYFQNFVARISSEGCGLEFKLPAVCKLVFSAQPPKSATFTGDFFILETSEGAVRGAFVDAVHMLIEGNCQVQDSSDGKIKTLSRDGRTLIGVAESFDESLIESSLDEIISERSKWLSGQKLPAGLSDTEKNALIKAYSVIKTEVYAPEGRLTRRWTTPDRWPHQGMWLWDSVFHAMGLRHLDAQLAREAISSVLDCQEEDGYIPHMMRPDYNSEITQPPVLALGVKLIDSVEQNLEWVKESYPKLKKYLEWNRNNRDKDGAGLLEWFIEANENCRSGESGMDNSPRFDGAVQLDATDFNSFQALEYDIMVEFAERLGLAEDAEHFRALHAELCEKINKYLWNEETGFYHDFDPALNEQTGILACSGFLPLICGAASKEQAEKLLQHIDDPETFGVPFPVPSVAKCSEKEYSKDMWRGPTWTNYNWLISLGLARYGYTDRAEKLVADTVAEQTRFFEKYGTFFEYYDDRKEVDPPKLLRKGKNAPEIDPVHQAIFDYGWSGTLFIDMMYKLHMKTNCSKLWELKGVRKEMERLQSA